MSPHTSRQSRPQSNATSVTASLLTRFDAADRLASCVRTIDEAIATGELEIVRIGRSVRIRPIALERFIEARTTRCNPRRASHKATKKAAASLA